MPRSDLSFIAFVIFECQILPIRWWRFQFCSIFSLGLLHLVFKRCPFSTDTVRSDISVLNLVPAAAFQSTLSCLWRPLSRIIPGLLVRYQRDFYLGAFFSAFSPPEHILASLCPRCGIVYHARTAFLSVVLSHTQAHTTNRGDYWIVFRLRDFTLSTWAIELKNWFLRR